MSDIHIEPELPGMPEAPTRHVADHRPDVYLEGDTVVIRASSLGRCTKSLVAQGLGMDREPPPAKIVNAMEESADLEPEVLAWARRMVGPKTKYRTVPPREGEAGGVRGAVRPHQGQWELNWQIGGGCVVRGHMDELVSIYTQVSGGYLGKAFIEGKAFGDSYWSKWKKHQWEGFSDYAWQFSIYGHGLQLPGWMVVTHKQDGKIQEGEMLWVPVEDMPISRGTIIARALKIARAVREEKMPETCDRNDWPCPTWYLHDETQEELEEIEDDEVVGLVAEYRELKAQAGEVGSRMDEIKAEIFLRMKPGKYKAGANRVVLSVAEMPAQTREVKAHTRRTLKVEDA